MADASELEKPGRRDFLYIATGAFGALGVGIGAWPLLDQMNPDASVKALASIEVDISTVGEGESLTVNWRGKPVFIRHRTAAEIKASLDVPLSELKDPQTDAERAEKPEWLIMVGVCTHLGCIPLGEAGEYNGWFCPCHNSVYDTAGRIRKGPAPLNMEIPEYEFLTDTKIKIG